MVNKAYNIRTIIYNNCTFTGSLIIQHEMYVICVDIESDFIAIRKNDGEFIIHACAVHYNVLYNINTCLCIITDTPMAL